MGLRGPQSRHPWQRCRQFLHRRTPDLDFLLSSFLPTYLTIHRDQQNLAMTCRRPPQTLRLSTVTLGGLAKARIHLRCLSYRNTRARAASWRVTRQLRRCYASMDGGKYRRLRHEYHCDRDQPLMTASQDALSYRPFQARTQIYHPIPHVTTKHGVCAVASDIKPRSR